LEVAVSNLMLNLTRRDADVALRTADNPPETLVGRRVGRIAFAIYGAADHPARHETDLAGQRWIGPDDTLAGTSVARWMRARLPGSEIVLRADSLLAMQQAALAGLGLTALPCYLGDVTPGLARIGGPIAEMETALWILSHEDLRAAARVRAFTEFAYAAFRRRRALLEGEGAPAAAQAVSDLRTP
jgi:DNA-binding transcriptional LysR family regulator